MKINVYGTGLSAVKFVLENNDLEINAFIEGKKSVDEFLPELFPKNTKVIPLMNAEQVLKKYFTVVAATPNAYWEIKKQLETEYNLVEFEDFCYFEIYRKKIALIYGNCHTQPIKEALQLSKIFNSIYGFYPLHPICNIQALGGAELKAAVFERCDLFIHQCIWERNTYGVEYASASVMKKLNSSCIKIGIPNLYRMPRFMFPQMKSEENLIYRANYNFFPFRDFYIDNNYKNLKINEIVDMIHDDNLIDCSEILDGKQLFFEKVEMREKEWDIKISEFLKESFKTKQLFFDPNHPTNEVISYIVREIFCLLKIDADILDLSNLCILDTYELPIYASVYKALGLEYKVDYLRKYSKHTLNHSQMNLEEYIRQYIRWNYFLEKD